MRYLYEVCEARVFALFALDELQRWTLLTAQMRHLLLKLISSLSLQLQHTHTESLMCFMSKSTAFKRIAHSNINIGWKYPPFQSIQDVEEFVSSSDLEKCISVSAMGALQ